MRKALKTVLCVALVLALAVVIALRVLPPMNAPAQSAAATPTPAAAAAPTPTPEPDNGLPKVNAGSWELTLVNAHNSIGEAVPEDLAELEGGRYFDARAVDALKERVGIKKTIRDYGIDEADFLNRLDAMVEQAFDDQCTGANPRYPLMSEIKQMYRNAYYGTQETV